MIQKLLPYKQKANIKDILRFIKSFSAYGDQYKCPFCEGNFSRFLPIGIKSEVLEQYKVVGGGYRLNAVCPRCNSVDRERLIQMYLDQEKSYIYKDPIKVLHIAPEQNLKNRFKSYSNIEYISADLNPLAADIQMDITDIKQPDGSYDVIICNHVIEHIPNDIQAMKELYRVLKPKGFAILQVPISYQLENTIEDESMQTESDRLVAFGQKDHVRIYGRDYSSRLRTAGFNVEEFPFVLNSKKTDISKYSLLEDEKVFVCSKL